MYRSKSVFQLSVQVHVSTADMYSNMYYRLFVLVFERQFQHDVCVCVYRYSSELSNIYIYKRPLIIFPMLCAEMYVVRLQIYFPVSFAV